MKKTVQAFIFYSSLLFVTVGHTQTDSLATTSYDELRDIIIEKLRQKDTLVALEIIDYHRDRAEMEKNYEEVAFGYGRRGYVSGANGDLEDGLINLDKAIAITEQHSLKELELRSHISKGVIYIQNGLFPESIASYYTALELSYQKQDYATAFSIINTLGWIKGNMEDHDGAIEILQRGLKNLSIENRPLDEKIATRSEFKISFLSNIAKAHLNAVRPDSTIFYLDRAEELTVLPNDSCLINIIFEVRADALITKNNFNQALDYLKKSTEYCNPMTSLDSLRYSGHMGSIYLGKKQYQKAITALNQGLKIYEVSEDEEKYMKDYYKTLAKAHKNIGHLDSANFFLEKHLHTTSGFSEMREDLTNSFRAQEIKEFKKELTELAEQKSEREDILLYGGIAGGILIVALITGLVNSNNQRKENEQKFEALLAKVAAAKEPEDIIDTKDTVLEEQSASDVNPETTQQILEGLKKLEAQNYFLHPACSAHNVAKRIKTNTTYLSKVINAEFGKNFSTYVNDLRINYAIVKLKEDAQFRKYTISSIATELGYKSADSFTKYFKKDTGLLPSFYIKKLDQVA